MCLHMLTLPWQHLNRTKIKNSHTPWYISLLPTLLPESPQRSWWALVLAEMHPAHQVTHKATSRPRSCSGSCDSLIVSCTYLKKRWQQCGISPLLLHHHQHLSLAVDDHFHLMDVRRCGTHPHTITAGASIIYSPHHMIARELIVLLKNRLWSKLLTSRLN